MLDIFGKYSLTIYMAHMVIYILPLPLDYITIWIPTLAFVFLVWLWFIYMDKWGKSKISLEYLMGIFGAWIFRKFTGESRHKDKSRRSDPYQSIPEKEEECETVTRREAG